jgi:hypothetical protein
MEDINLERLLHDNPAASQAVTLGQIVRFVTLASRLTDDILLTQPPAASATDPPDFLPPSVIAFLGECCLMSVDRVEQYWDILKGMIWHGGDKSPESTVVDMFTRYGHQYGLCEQSSIPYM